MTTSSVPSRLSRWSPGRPSSERGVVLFIALLVMVALSLAGIALIRSADTATIVAGNLSFTQAATNAVDRSIEQAIEALFNPVRPPAIPVPTIADKRDDIPSQNYFACVQAALGGGCNPPTEPIPEIPFVVATRAAAANLTAIVPNDDAGNRSFYVIERMCAGPGAAVAANCNLSTLSLGADAGTQHYEGLVRPGDAFYRVTVRVEGPRNTVAYAQAILQ